MRLARHTLAVSLFVVSSLALAASFAYVRLEDRLTPEQMHETGLDTLTPQQLARLNALLGEEEAARPVVASPTASHDPRAQDEQSFLGLSEEPIRSRVKGRVAGWQPDTVFSLENGQQWKVLKGSLTLRKPLDAPEVIVAPGLMGRWFLQVDPDLPKARVYRID
jgi:hypothetical protein